MKKILDERLIYEILSVVEEIPRGKVATYGQIARLIGKEKKCKTCGQGPQYGRILRQLSLPPRGQSRRKTGSWLA